MTTIKQQIESWAKSKGLELVPNGWLNDGVDNMESPQDIKVKECKLYTYIYLPFPDNLPYRHRYQVKIANGRAFIFRYLFK